MIRLIKYGSKHKYTDLESFSKNHEISVSIVKSLNEF